MARWREYQEEAAALFRSLGLDAATDERVDGARGLHSVDVVLAAGAPAWSSSGSSTSETANPKPRQRDDRSTAPVAP
jgi:hypothetical protein